MSLATFTTLDGSPALTPTTCWSMCAAPNRWPPTTSAARAGMTIPSIEEVATRILVDSDGHDATLVEGAGGILVGLDQ